MTKEQIADYIVFLLKPLAPEATCDVQVDDLGTLYTVHVDDTNKGRIIGKAGETAKAIRHIVSLIGYANQIKVSIKIA